MGEVIYLQKHLADAIEHPENSGYPSGHIEVLKGLEQMIKDSEVQIPALAQEARRLHLMIYDGDWFQGATCDDTEDMLREKGFQFPANLAAEIHDALAHPAIIEKSKPARGWDFNQP